MTAADFMLAMADKHPLLSFFAICATYYVIKLPFWITSRIIRACNIANAGWPDAPMDADGDIILPKADQS